MFKKVNYKWRILSENWKPEIRNYTTLSINWTTLQLRAPTSLKD